MTVYRAQFTFKATDGNPDNAVTNTWYCAGTSDADAASFVVAVKAFYTTMRTYMSSLVAIGPHVIKTYDMTDPEPRAPIVEENWSFTVAPTGAPLPPEVSLCLSFQGEKISGVPQARHRGRIYFGPITQSVNGADGRPTPAFCTSFANAGSVLKLASQPAGTWDWSVFSPTSGTSVIVTDGWVDNEWDTQRRRGRERTSKSLF